MEIYLNAGNNRKKWYWFHFLIALYRIPSEYSVIKFIWRTTLWDIEREFKL
jgi:hypothetical protein